MLKVTPTKINPNHPNTVTGSGVIFERMYAMGLDDNQMTIETVIDMRRLEAEYATEIKTLGTDAGAKLKIARLIGGFYHAGLRRGMALGTNALIKETN